MNDEEPMTQRQRERLIELKIDFDEPLTLGEAADLIRAECQSRLYSFPPLLQRLPETAFAVESEGDRGEGRQWLP